MGIIGFRGSAKSTTASLALTLWERSNTPTNTRKVIKQPRTVQLDEANYLAS